MNEVRALGTPPQGFPAAWLDAGDNRNAAMPGIHIPLKEMVTHARAGEAPGMAQTKASATSVDAVGGTTEQVLLFAPPQPCLPDVDARAAEQAWRELVTELREVSRRVEAETGGKDKAANRKEERDAAPSLADLANWTNSLDDAWAHLASPALVLLAALQLNNEMALMTMKNGAMSDKMFRAEQAAALERKARLDEEQHQRQQALQQDAGKGEVGNLVCTWVQSAAEVASGVVQLASGQPQGVVDLADGVLGFTRSALMTVEVANPQMRGKFHGAIEKLAKIEHGLGIASSILCAASVARMGVMAYRAVKGAACDVLEKSPSLGSDLVGLLQRAEESKKLALDPALTLAEREAQQQAADTALEAAQKLCRDVGKEIASESAGKMDDVVRIFGKSNPVSRLFGRSFPQEAVATMMETALMDAAKAGVSTKDELIKFVSDKVAANLGQQMAWMASRINASMTAAIPVARVASTATTQIVNAENDKKRGQEAHRIGELAVQSMALEFMIEQIDKTVRRNQKDREAQVKQTESQREDLMDGFRDHLKCLQQTAGAMV